MNPIQSLHDLRHEVPDEAAARALFERLVWPSGPHCPCCVSAVYTPWLAEARSSCSIDRWFAEAWGSSFAAKSAAFVGLAAQERRAAGSGVGPDRAPELAG